MTSWLVFGEHIIGRVEAASREMAERAAYQAYGQTHAVARVQSAASYECGQDEIRSARHRLPPEEAA